jgi:integrase/recombinase XerD
MVDLDLHFGLREAQRDPARAGLRLWPRHRVTGWRVIKHVMMLAQIVGVAACPRGLRHAFGVSNRQAGIPVELTQRWMGHARRSTPEIYTSVSGPDEVAFARMLWKFAEGGSALSARARRAPPEI